MPHCDTCQVLHVVVLLPNGNNTFCTYCKNAFAKSILQLFQYVGLFAKMPLQKVFCNKSNLPILLTNTFCKNPLFYEEIKRVLQ